MSSTLVIVPSYGQFPYVIKTVESALQSSPDVHVAVIDDASSDWQEDFWSKWSISEARLSTFRFPENGGVTRSWNQGLLLAKQLGFSYASAANSDLLFPKGWLDSCIKILDESPEKLLGPVTNEPGHRPKQNVTRYHKSYKRSDKIEEIQTLQDQLAKEYQNRFKQGPINGYCMFALTSTWWSNAFDENHVFNPGKRFRMIRNEDELQGRWKWENTAIVPGSFVFHYRGVSRNPKTKKSPPVVRKVLNRKRRVR